MPFARCLLLALTFSAAVSAQERAAPPGTKTVAQLAEDAKPSTATILYTGRDGRTTGIGTGFVVGDGLIATNLHVIGEGRPITVQLSDGTKHEATAVHASDRKLDLAIVRIDAANLKPLPLGGAAKLKQGIPIVVLGHPRGLEYSVVSGVLSGRRDMEGVSMLQLAIPIEQGNSGGPVLDMQGRVLGVVTMKSLVTPNLGFAVPIDALKPLLKRPNPVPMEQWLTLGALDKGEWKTVYGARWRQRAGRIVADGSGTGFGGRTLCYSQRSVPEFPFELAVSVKLDNEAGAAGLIFGGDGNDRHYGFYPTGGKLRLTQFNGPAVYSWEILHDLVSPAYRPGDWNTLKVRLEKDRVVCFVNDQQVIELDNPKYAGTALGLAKFRDTVAEYKKFQAAARLAPATVVGPRRAAFEKTLARLPATKEIDVKALQPLLARPDESTVLLRDRARTLEEEAVRLRKLAQAVHQERCLAELARLCQAADAKTDLLRAALLIARLDNEDLDVEAYVKEVDRLADLVHGRLAKDAAPAARLDALNRFLFKERGFHGSRAEYYSRANSYLNEVIDDREGLPITLAVLYMELARRLDLNVVGVALPGHFVVRHEPAKGAAQLIDVYEGGKPLTAKDAETLVQELTGHAPEAKDLETVAKKAIVRRMLHNLLSAARREEDQPGMLRYLDALLAVEPASHEERWVRAVLRYQAGQRVGALADCDDLIQRVDADADLDRVRDLRRLLVPAGR
jgi:serine protease Do